MSKNAIFEIWIDKQCYHYPPEKPTEIKNISSDDNRDYVFVFDKYTSIAGTGKPGRRHVLEAKTREYTGCIVDGPTVRILRLDQQPA
ncbi:hypothetical protein KBC75_03775 [Candidatus Shapirobacteria bacterium]|nr:hypothetical protein [Candidatus Shapirobacteria bacterium]